MVLFVSFLDLVGVARCESVFIWLFYYLFGFLKGSRIIQDLMHKMKGWKNFKIIFVRIFTHDGCVPVSLSHLRVTNTNKENWLHNNYAKDK